MVDGLISLKAFRVGLQTVREIEVEKHRGSGQLLGASFYEIPTKESDLSAHRIDARSPR